MKFKKVDGIVEFGKKWFICEFDEKWSVYKNNDNGTCNFVWKFKTLEEAKEFVKKQSEVI